VQLKSVTCRHSSPLKIRVLRLQPCPRPAADVPGARALQNDAFEAQTAGVAEDGSTVSGDRLAHLDAVTHCALFMRETRDMPERRSAEAPVAAGATA
jgi:hypothetical protein